MGRNEETEGKKKKKISKIKETMRRKEGRKEKKREKKEICDC